MRYETVEKIVESNGSRIYADWNEHTGISKETFLEGIKWLCEEPHCYPHDHPNRWARGKLIRELGIRRDGALVYMRRVYGVEGICSFYNWNPAHNRLSQLARGVEASLSVRDRV